MPSLFPAPVRVLPLALLLLSCHRKSEEDRVRALLDQGVEQVETGKVAAATDHLTEDFQDAAGNDRQAAKALLLSQVLRGGGEVSIYRRNQAVTVDGSEGAASFEALLTRGKHQTVLGSLPADAQTFHFDLALRKEAGEWKIRRAAWKEIPGAEFLKP